MESMGMEEEVRLDQMIQPTTRVGTMLLGDGDPC